MKWGFRLKFNRIAKIVGLIAALLTTVAAGFTFIGANGANFVVNFEKSNGLNLSMYESEDLANPVSRLSYPSVLDQVDVTITNLPDNIEDGLGNKSDYEFGRYMAFSFLLKNNSNVDVDIELNINMSKIKKGVDSAIRVMLIKDGEKNIFAKPKEYPDKDAGSPEDYPYQTEIFVSPNRVCSKKYDKMKIGEIYKFTVVVWLEGYDKQCVDAIKGGTMSMDMSIKIV